MSTLPLIEAVLLEIHQSFGGNAYPTNKKNKFATGQNSLDAHKVMGEEVLLAIFEAMDMDPLAQFDATNNLMELAKAYKSIELKTWTFAADQRQILWSLLGHFFIPGLARRVAFWSLGQALDKGMPGGRFWYLPEPRDEDGKSSLYLPVAQVVDWLLDLLGMPLEQVADLRSGATDGIHEGLRRSLYNWRNDTPIRLDSIQKYFPDNAELVFKGIPEHHKTWMLENGEWRAMAEGKTAGFHLSSLYSPVGWRSWREIAAAWEAAVNKESGSAAAIKTFKNTELGETWVEEGEAPDWQRLVERREDYRIGSVPAGGLLLVGGADVQKDRIEASVWAFGRGKECWLIEHRVLMGDTARDAVWKRLAEMLAESWTHASGAALPLARFALDTGFATQEAYAFVRACRDSRVMAVKGVARGAALIGTPTAVDMSQGGKKLRRGTKVFAVAGGIAKLEFYNNLRKNADVEDDGLTIRYPTGFVHLPKIDAEFIQQLCAEQLITRRDRNGYPVREWQKMRERNEALDCYVYARAAASAAGLDRFEERHWRELERQLGMASPPSETTEIEPNEATDRSQFGGGLAVSGNRNTGRRVIKSRWLS